MTMSGKNSKKAPSDTAPARTERTAADYGNRYRQLKREAQSHLREVPTLERFVDWLIESKRPTLCASSWRQIRAATVFGLELKAAGNPGLRETINVAIARLKCTRPAKRRNPFPRTSQQKAKRFLPGDLDRISHSALAGRAPTAPDLAAFLDASSASGLRPSEWPTAVFRQSNVVGFAWELIVRNGKVDGIRAHGETRTLRWVTLTDEIVSAITGWITQARQAENDGTYRTLCATMQALMRRLTKSLFPGRHKRPTLYTPRHEAAARWKACYVDSATTFEARMHGLAVVAALLGHASDATATAHYGRPHQGERGSSRFPVPAPDAAEVARVRRRMQQNLERLAARLRPGGHQP
jgi:integrase